MTSANSRRLILHGVGDIANTYCTAELELQLELSTRHEDASQRHLSLSMQEWTKSIKGTAYIVGNQIIY